MRSKCLCALNVYPFSLFSPSELPESGLGHNEQKKPKEISEEQLFFIFSKLIMLIHIFFNSSQKLCSVLLVLPGFSY